LSFNKLPKHFYSSKNFRAFFIKGDSSLLRVSLQKKNFKLAVDRNKYKRRIKEVFRTNNLYKDHGCFVFLIYKPFIELKPSEASVEIIKAVKSANL
jgi:ribonuclease P protein component